MKRPVAALTLGLSLALSASWGEAAFGDLVQTVDGGWQGVGRDAPALGPNDGPSADHLRQTAESPKADATYETVKLGRWSSPAGLVRAIWASEQETVAAFKEGFAQAGGGLYEDAVESFRAAAEETTGFAKQQALYYRMQASTALKSGSVEATRAAIDELLGAFPNTYYFADAQILRAKLDAGDPAAVGKALDAIKGAKGMNARDQYRAEYYRILMLLERAKKYAEAKDAYAALVAQIDKGDAAAGATVRQLAQVGIGNCLLRVNPPQVNEAQAAFSKAAAESNDPDVLAGAYVGLGNVAFGSAKQFQDEKKLPEAQAKLTEATQHYLRVTLLYQDRVTENAPVLDAYENQAKAFVALFRQSDGKDCVAAERAYKAYFDLHDRLDGAEKRRVIREANEFNRERKDKGCK